MINADMYRGIEVAGEVPPNIHQKRELAAKKLGAFLIILIQMSQLSSFGGSCNGASKSWCRQRRQ